MCYLRVIYCILLSSAKHCQSQVGDSLKKSNHVGKCLRLLAALGLVSSHHLLPHEQPGTGALAADALHYCDADGVRPSLGLA